MHKPVLELVFHRFGCGCRLPAPCCSQRPIRSRVVRASAVVRKLPHSPRVHDSRVSKVARLLHRVLALRGLFRTFGFLGGRGTRRFRGSGFAKGFDFLGHVLIRRRGIKLLSRNIPGLCGQGRVLIRFVPASGTALRPFFLGDRPCWLFGSGFVLVCNSNVPAWCCRTAGVVGCSPLEAKDRRIRRRGHMAWSAVRSYKPACTQRWAAKECSWH